jgi:allantoicase
VEQLTSDAANWTDLVHQGWLKGDTHNYFEVKNPERFTHLRFKIFPDGGVARLRAYGEVLPEWEALRGREIDLAAVENGGRALMASDLHYGPPHNLLMPGRGVDMGDGWETKRRRGPGHDWAILKLGAPGVITRAEVDTAHFKGNFPESCSIEACSARGRAGDALSTTSVVWLEVLPRTKLEADKQHVFEKEIRAAGAVTHVRFNIFPDGGVSRLRLFGHLSEPVK